MSHILFFFNFFVYSPNINTNPAHSTTSSEMSQSIASKRDVETLLDLGKKMKADLDKMVQRPTTVKEEFLEMLEMKLVKQHIC